MLTQYPAHVTWTPTPDEQADIDAQRALDAANRERRAMYYADPKFMDACAALEAREGLLGRSICIYAGHRFGAVDSYPDTFVTTPEQCLEVYRHYHPKPFDPKAAQVEAAMARTREREAKAIAHAEYVEAYNAYTTACRERKERIAAAQKECARLVAEAEREFTDLVKEAAERREGAISSARHFRDEIASEPVPTPPVKRQ